MQACLQIVLLFGALARIRRTSPPGSSSLESEDVRPTFIQLRVAVHQHLWRLVLHTDTHFRHHSHTTKRFTLYLAYNHGQWPVGMML